MSVRRAGRGGAAATRVFGLLALALALAAGAADAQQRPPRGMDRSELEERVRARFAEMVKLRLGLDDAGEERLAATVAAFQDDRRALGRRKGELARRIRALEPAEGTPEVDPVTARALLDELAAIRVEEARLFRAEQDAILEVLTPVQALHFYLIREEMADRIRRARGRRGGDEADRRRGPPPGAW